ncbi:MAG: NAD(P)/FAD-dependent oxidoreductase [Candidatus Marsarchaeota archaeon]|jgi:flavin-dependent dehydrogenase|nr:NAD(P)/FAD-dependent oxidoreductase [Candidatus Marsarchaeota archaeon]MCL5418628.1 NAD(P)/FAD-dependent oxidoreductase [Candidatus Marsarchaeota archaeon]
MESYDVVVAGAGMSGSLAAAMAAKGGASVLLLDRNKEEEVGKKTNWGWVCGDAVAKGHLDFLYKEAGISFSQPELDLKVDGVLAFSPDLQHKFKFEGEGYSLDRPSFEHKLLKFAIDSGVHYESEFEVEGPLIEGSSVAGVFGRDKSKERKDIKAKVVIDALGIATVLRRKLPENPFVDRDIDIDDIESTGRYIYQFDQDHDDLNYYDPKNAIIHLNQELAPGGYGWVFPKSGNRVNIGLGVQKSSFEIRNQKLGKKDTLHSLIDAYVNVNPVVKNVRIDTSNNNGRGYWSVAVRRQLESLVFNGYLGAGDSMAMPNPLSAGGIGPSLVAGVLAGKQAAKAVQNNDTSIKGMWDYNLSFNDAYGNKTAGLEVFRIYLQSLNNDMLNYGMKTFISAKEAEDLSYGLVPELSVAAKFKTILKGAQNINAFRNLLFVVKKMKALNELYRQYPKSPDDFAKWRGAVEAHIKEAKERFRPNPI